MRCLITGGFGFIGSHLAEVLLEQGADVHIVDNMQSSPLDVLAYLARLEKLPTYSLCSLRDYFSNGAAMFDEVYHLASVVGPVGVLKHGGLILDAISRDTYAVVDYTLEADARMVDVSTSEVYGGGQDGFCAEDASMIVSPMASIRQEYAVAKLGCEVALRNLAKTKGLRVGIVRPFNVAGPRQAPAGGYVLPRFVGQALRGEPLTVYGQGTAVRAFTHVRDVVDGIIRVMRRGNDERPYNLGNPANKTTIQDLAVRVIRQTGSESTIEHVDPKTLWGPLFEEAHDKYPDAGRAMRELEWQPQASLDTIIGEMAEYARQGRRA